MIRFVLALIFLIKFFSITCNSAKSKNDWVCTRISKKKKKHFHFYCLTLLSARDPPGQRSAYIPPGDNQTESYRLSTYLRFPSASPANPRVLAAVGFFYTGYKDRVKCFSCANCVDNWTINDDLTSTRWHKHDCAMMLQNDSGNVPLGKMCFSLHFGVKIYFYTRNLAVLLFFKVVCIKYFKWKL